jgi:hypothetical protein
VPLASAVANVKAPFAETVRLSPPLSCSTSPVPVRPVTVPPIVTPEPALVVQVTATLVTFALAVPLPLATVQVCPDGGVRTVTA